MAELESEVLEGQVDSPAELDSELDAVPELLADVQPEENLEAELSAPVDINVEIMPETVINVEINGAGPRGKEGPEGPPGDDGVSPVISIVDIPGGHRLTITDASGPHSVDVMDGVGVPAGGTTGQFLAKASDDDHDTEWADETDPVFSASPAAGIDASDIQNWNGKYPGMVSITSGSADMNDYKTAGIYYFSSGATLTNVPNSAGNGWLVVLAASNSVRKQIWYRHGSNPNTFKDMYQRLYSSGWGDWSKLLNTSDLLNFVYPVGSIYVSTDSASPASFLGGTWARITGRFLLGATDGGSSGASQEAGNTGGSATHTLTEAQLPTISGTMRLYAGRGTSAGGRSNIVYGRSGVFTTADYGSSNYYTVPVDGATSMQLKPYQISMSFGSGNSHNNMPPYRSVYMWERTA